MKAFLSVLVLILAVIDYGRAEREREEKGGPTNVKILGQSGRIMISFPKRGKQSIVIDFDEMKERDRNNAEVGKTGKMKHSFNSFARQEFNFSKVVRYEYNGLKTKTFNFTAMIKGTGATLNVEVYVFLEEGDFTNGNETTKVKNGTVKFNIELKDWQFCNGSSNCKNNEYGKFVDLTIAVVSRSKPKKRSPDSRQPPKKGKRFPEQFELGDGALFDLSRQVDVDGTLKEMPEGFPKHESRGVAELFTFRFPKFKGRLLYDPAITLEDDSNSALTLGASVVVFLGALIAAILASF